jgi:murein DD-endopeptidase MepM/ murein hydrolase activator NlpD
MYLRLCKHYYALLLVMGLILILNSPIALASDRYNRSTRIDRAQERTLKPLSDIDKATSNYEESNKKMRIAQQELQQNKLKLKQEQANQELDKEFLNQRIVFYYKNGTSSVLEILASSKNYGDFLSKIKMLAKVVKSDSDFSTTHSDSRNKRIKTASLAVKKAEENYDKALAATIDDKIALEQSLLKGTIRTASLDREILKIKFKIRAKTTVRYAMASSSSFKNSRVYVSRGGMRSSFVFPVAGPHKFIDSFGFPRSGGRHHKGNDIMSATGTPLLACVSGTIERTCPYDRSLGGITIYLRCDNGDIFYYAHLSAIEDGIEPGVRVNAGDLIGFVGSTGNASSTAPHLHFEFHPGGGGAVDPFAILCSADDPSMQAEDATEDNEYTLNGADNRQDKDKTPEVARQNGSSDSDHENRADSTDKENNLPKTNNNTESGKSDGTKTTDTTSVNTQTPVSEESSEAQPGSEQSEVLENPSSNQQNTDSASNKRIPTVKELMKFDSQ